MELRMVQSESDHLFGMFEASSRGHLGSQINRMGCVVVWVPRVIFSDPVIRAL